jgi:predicted AAA+ superfamily ATPase
MTKYQIRRQYLSGDLVNLIEEEVTEVKFKKGQIIIPDSGEPFKIVDVKAIRIIKHPNNENSSNLRH